MNRPTDSSRCRGRSLRHTAATGPGCTSSGATYQGPVVPPGECCRYGASLSDRSSPEAQPERLLARLFEGNTGLPCNDREFARKLRDRACGDYVAGRVVQLDVWIPAVTEARRYALANLV